MPGNVFVSLTVFIVMNSEEAYLVDALVLLAEVYPQPLTVAEIARRRAIPAPFLGRLLAAASRRGVVTTERGRRGGVRLADPPDRIVAAALLDGGTAVTRGGPAARWLAGELRRVRSALLAGITLVDLRERERAETEALSWEV